MRAACPADLIIIDLVIPIIFDKELPTNYEAAPHSAVFSALSLRLKYSPPHPVL
jgi:hypothetical protein